jgi:hypothetical protein
MLMLVEADAMRGLWWSRDHGLALVTLHLSNFVHALDKKLGIKRLSSVSLVKMKASSRVGAKNNRNKHSITWLSVEPC